MQQLDKYICIKECYPKDHIIAHRFHNENDYQSLYELLFSIYQKEDIQHRLSDNDFFKLIELKDEAFDMMNLVDNFDYRYTSNYDSLLENDFEDTDYEDIDNGYIREDEEEF